MTSADYPSGRRRRHGDADRRRARVALPARLDRQPAVRDRGRRGGRGARPGRDRPRDRAQRAVPEPHQRLVHPRSTARRCGRGSSSAGWGRRSPRAPAPAARRWRRSSRRGEPDHGAARRRRADGGGRRRARGAADRHGRAGLLAASCRRSSCATLGQALGRRSCGRIPVGRATSETKRALTEPSQRLEAMPAVHVRRARAAGGGQARGGHRRDQPRDRRPRPPTYPHIVEAMQAAVADPANHKYPSNRGRAGVPRRRSRASTSERFGVEIDPEIRGDPGDRRQGVHLQPLLRVPRPRRRRARRRPRLSRLHRRPAARRRRGGAAAAAPGARASCPTSTRSPPRRWPAPG